MNPHHIGDEVDHDGNTLRDVNNQHLANFRDAMENHRVPYPDGEESINEEYSGYGSDDVSVIYSLKGIFRRLTVALHNFFAIDIP